MSINIFEFFFKKLITEQYISELEKAKEKAELDIQVAKLLFIGNELNKLLNKFESEIEIEVWWESDEDLYFVKCDVIDASNKPDEYLFFNENNISESVRNYFYENLEREKNVKWLVNDIILNNKNGDFVEQIINQCFGEDIFKSYLNVKLNNKLSLGEKEEKLKAKI